MTATMKIAASILIDASRRVSRDKAQEGDVDLLRAWKLENCEEKTDNLLELTSLEGKYVGLIGNHIQAYKESSGVGSSNKKGEMEAEKKAREEEEIRSSNEEVIDSVDKLNNFLANYNKFKINEDALKATLEEYIKSAFPIYQYYMPGELIIKHSGPISDNILIAAGTKVLDAMMYISLLGKAEAQKIFSFEQIDAIESTVAAKNIITAKRAIQAAIALVYVQGELPANRGEDRRRVPKFIKSEIYNGEIDSLIEIGTQLSCASTMKFPARMILNISVNCLPVKVASMCKLLIAGNRAVRYACFAGEFEKCSMVEPHGDAARMLEIMNENRRKDKAIKIADFLRSVNWEAQLCLHPLTPNRPDVKSLTLKLTRAIIESLSRGGRIDMADKIISNDINAIKIDKRFFGEMRGNAREWDIISDIDADFSDLSVEVLKNYFTPKKQ